MMRGLERNRKKIETLFLDSSDLFNGITDFMDDLSFRTKFREGRISRDTESEWTHDTQVFHCSTYHGITNIILHLCNVYLTNKF